MKLKKVILFIIMGFVFMSRMFAIETEPGVYVNEEEPYQNNLVENDYADDTVVFENKNNINTLTLENYNGKGIYIEGFSEEDTFNIILKGTNIIDSDTEGIYVNGILKELKITSENNGKLVIKNVDDGILFENGDLIIDNANIDLTNTTRTGIWGNNIEINGGTININTVSGSGIYGNNIIINDGTINITTNEDNIDSGAAGIDAKTINVNGGTININTTKAYGLYATDAAIKSGNVAITTTDGIGIFIDNININGGITKVNTGIGYGIESNGIVINDGLLDVNSSSIGVFLIYGGYGGMKFNGGTTHIKSNDAPALIAIVLKDGNVFILNNSIIKDNNLNIVNSSVKIGDAGNYQQIYSFSDKSIAAQYERIEDAAAQVTEEITVLGNKKLIFDANGGSGSMDAMNSYEGKFTLPTETTFIAPKNMKLKGWSLTKDGEIITLLETHENTTVYAIWEDARNYSYKFILDNTEFDKNNVSIKTLKIDGSYAYFDKLEIEGIDLIKGTDYTVSEGSTVITFTDSGLIKLNTLGVGTHKLVAKYINGKNAEGSFTIKETIIPKKEENPKTYDNGITFIISGLISLICLSLSTIYLKKKKFN